MSIFNHWLLRINSENLKILELGCGVGNYSGHLLEKGYDVTSIDIDHNSLAYFRRQECSGKCNLICADITTHVLKENIKYDVIIISDVLEHLTCPDEALDNIHKFLKDKGMAFITVPNGFGPWEILNKIKANPLLNKLLYFPFYWPVYIKNILSSKKIKKNHQIDKTHSTLNQESPHVQFWTFHKFVSLIEGKNFYISDVYNSNVDYSWVPYYYRIKRRKIDILDAKVADHLPHWIVSGWVFKLKKKE